MRVKLILALAIASIFLLAGALPAGAVTNFVGPNGVVVNVPAINAVPNVGPVSVQPCISGLAVQAPTVSTFGAVGPLNLVAPSIGATITLSGPPGITFAPPSFILPQLSPPAFTVGFTAGAPVFDP
jgi:hypothetical protein